MVRVERDVAASAPLRRRARHLSARIGLGLAAASLIALASADLRAQPDSASKLGFAVIADALTRPADEAPVRQLLDTIGRDRDTSFIVYDGNLKGAAEPCRDTIYDARHALLDASRVPLVLLPGQHDWADCGLAQAGAYDPVERLDFVRQLFYVDGNSLGQTPMSVTRESEVARFRPFRENVRWQANGIAFIGLNAPGPNNHYLTAGGRNGEFEDRSVANAFWLEHAVESARRAEARAVVVVIQGDPDFTRFERRDRFAWLRFTRNNPTRDGFLEIKRSLVKAAELFHGPIIVIHGTNEPLPFGFRIDQPLRNDKGVVVTNLTRIAMALKKPQTQWLDVQTDSGWRPPFRVRVRDATTRLNMTARPDAPVEASPTEPTEPFFQRLQPGQPRNDLPASVPAPPALPPSTPPAMPPILSAPAPMPPLLPASGSSVTGPYAPQDLNADPNIIAPPAKQNP